MPNEYDRMMRENIGKLILPMASKYLGLNIVEATPLPEKVQITRDREADYLGKVRLDNGKEFILHLEFQTKNESNMHLRMLDYHASLILKYNIEVYQAVIYMGRPLPTFRTELEEHQIPKGFRLVDVARIPSREFLESELPEEVILAILADFEGRDPKTVIRYLTWRILEVSRNKAEAEKFFQQLRILSQISKFTLDVSKEIDDMPLNIDITKDPYYQRGEKRAQERTAISLIRMGLLSIEQVAFATGLPVEEVEKLKHEIED